MNTTTNNWKHKDGKVTKKIEDQTAKIPSAWPPLQHNNVA